VLLFEVKSNHIKSNQVYFQTTKIHRDKKEEKLQLQLYKKLRTTIDCMHMCDCALHAHGFASLKNRSRIAQSRFTTFPEYEWSRRSNSQTVQTGSTYISKSMTHIIKIPKVKLGFSTTGSSKKVSLCDSNNDGQLEMVAETGNRQRASFLQVSGSKPLQSWQPYY